MSNAALFLSLDAKISVPKQRPSSQVEVVRSESPKGVIDDSLPFDEDISLAIVRIHIIYFYFSNNKLESNKRLVYIIC